MCMKYFVRENDLPLLSLSLLLLFLPVFLLLMVMCRGWWRRRAVVEVPDVFEQLQRREVAIQLDANELRDRGGIMLCL